MRISKLPISIPPLVALVAAGSLILLASSGCADHATAPGGSFGAGGSGTDAGSSGGSGGGGEWENTGGGWGGSGGGSGAADAGAWPSDPNAGPTPGGNTNVNIGGASDFGYFRALVAAGQVPMPDQMEAAGFFAEHHTPLPQPVCGENVCIQAMLGVMANLINGNTCTLLQVGLNSPLVADESMRPPLSLAVVVDVSGSMNGDDKIAFVRDGLSKMVNELDDDDQLAIITYSSLGSVDWPMQPIQGKRNELQAMIAALGTGGGTNLYEGLEMGYEEVFANYDSGRQNRLILLSDGQPTAGIKDADMIVEMSKAYNSDGVGLTTIGLGTGFNYTLMRDLAEQADGNFYFVENGAAVDDVFTEELSYFTVPVAFDVEIQVAAGDDYEFERSYGSRLFETDETGGKLEVPSVFLAHRVSADDIVENPEGETGRRGGGSALLLELMPKEPSGEVTSGYVADVSLKFREPGTDEIKTEHIPVTYPYSPTDILATGYFDNAIVTKSFVMLNIYVALEVACTAWHAGQPEEAISVLAQLIAAASDYEDSANDGEGDLDIALDIELMQDLMGVMEAQLAPDVEIEPEIPDDPWPAD